MITIKLSEDFPLVLTFDGSVIEIFEDVESNRIHLTWIDRMELKTDKRGKHSLDIHTFGDSSLAGNEVDENAFPKVGQLIAVVQKAKAEFKFD